MQRLDEMARKLVMMDGPSSSALGQCDHAFIDTLGCVLGGNRHEDMAGLHRAAGLMGEGAAPAYGTALTFAAPQAAMVNASAAHFEELDDWEEPGNTHPSAVIWPALWALASLQPLAGDKLATAYAAGFESVARLGEAVNYDHYNRGWHSTATLGIVGAAAACAKALGLDAHGMAGAIGLALTQASGYAEQFGSMVKPMQAGFAARDGLSCGLLAQQGLCGNASILDGPRGFVALMADGDMDRLDAGIARINGAALDEWGLAMKLHPCCGYTHRLVDCAIEFHEEFNSSDLDAIVSVRLELPDFHHAILNDDWPRQEASARFCLAFVVATALVHGRVGREHIRKPENADARVRGLFERITTQVHKPERPELNFDEAQPDRLTAVLASGREIVRECAWPLGAPQRALSRNQVLTKFAQSAAPVGVHTELTNWRGAQDIAAFLLDVTRI